ncbi:MAG TPA: hypothetical protein VFF52_05920 [Isosphaeraceae bacterium]|nr:hypothetical protein [Isosphaeraceae bacterium]
MQRSGRHLARLCWSLTLGLTILLLSTEKAGAQYPIYGFGYGYPGMGYGYPGMGYGFAGMGYGFAGMGYGYPGMGYGYPGYGYGPGAGLAYPGAVYGFGYPGPYAWGYGNPLFGVGLSPLGVQSYLYETRVLGRVPRSSASSYSAASRRY